MDFHELLGESVTPEAISQLEIGLTEAIETVVLESEAEIAELKESAERYAVAVVTEREEELKESFLAEKEKLESEFTIKEVEYVTRISQLKEAAREYGKYVHDEIVEKADEYTSQYVEEFKSVNEKMFEKIQNEQTAHDVLLNVKHIFESFGMDTDQNEAIKQLRVELQESKAQIESLNNSLHENDIQKRKQFILDELTKDLSMNEKQVIVSAASDILTENADSFKNVVSIMVSKYAKSDDVEIVKSSENKIYEKVNTNTTGENDDIISFSAMRNNTQNIDDINKQII